MTKANRLRPWSGA